MKILKKEPQLAKLFAVIILLLLISTLSYVFSPGANEAADDSQPKEPIRVLMNTKNGKVLFDHSTHASKSGYGLSCTDCHHHPSDEEEAVQRSCDYCHVNPDKNKAFNENCLECHDQEEVEGVETNRLVVNNHQRGECIKCHTDFGKGPVDCKKCHM